MASSITICKECGGIVGAIEAMGGMKPCNCVRRNVSADSTIMHASAIGESVSGTGTRPGNGTVGTATPPPVGDSAPSIAAGALKVCCVCGKDVSGQRRFKDHRGYWCEVCHRDDARKSGKVIKMRCPECKNTVAENLMAEYNGQMLCGGCASQHKIDDEKAALRMAIYVREQKEKKKRYLQIAIAAACIIGVYVLYKFGVFGGGGDEQAAENETQTLMHGTRTMAIVFLVLLLGLIAWLKRQI
jgi:hypothetical protein